MKKFDDRLIVELSSTKVPGKTIQREFRDSMRGLRFSSKGHRPNRCKIIHVGKDFKKVQPRWDDFLEDLANCRDGDTSWATFTAGVDIDDLIHRMRFVQMIGKANEETA